VEIRQFPWNVIDSNSWLIIEGSDGLLIDAVDSQALFDSIKNLSSLTVILTHCHFDHIFGLNKIREIRPDATVISTKLCSEYIGNKFRNLSSVATAFTSFYNGGVQSVSIQPFECKPTDLVFEGMKDFFWAGHIVSLHSVYGHSADGLIAVINDCIFSGDTLLSISTTTRFPTGNKKRFRDEDIPLLKSFGKEYRVLPGHGDPMLFEDAIVVNEG